MSDRRVAALAGGGCSDPARRLCGLLGRFFDRLASAAILGATILCVSASASELSELPGRTADAPKEARGGGLPEGLERGSFVAVPIPVLNPSLDTGLILAAGYFHAQTEAQAAVQPASVTGVGAMYTSNESRAAMVGHSAYWSENRWRFKGGLGVAELNLDLLSADATGGLLEIDWQIKGRVLFLEVDRRVSGNWYLGVKGRVLDADQSFDIRALPAHENIVLGSHIRSSGLGLTLMRDTRDLPGNPYSGMLFNAAVLFNDPVFGSDEAYTSSMAFLRSYVQIAPRLVLASELQGCRRTGEVPLWDTCMLGLRGSPATDYLGRSSVRARVEGRWRLAGRWGLVTFAGVGRMIESFSGERDGQYVESYGVGLRFTVLEAKRTNLRVDYGRSEGSNALYISVGEAF